MGLEEGQSRQPIVIALQSRMFQMLAVFVLKRLTLMVNTLDADVVVLIVFLVVKISEISVVYSISPSVVGDKYRQGKALKHNHVALTLCCGSP